MNILNISDSDFKNMRKTQLNTLLKEKIKEISFTYLLGLRKSKGTEIEYKSLTISNYLLPNEFNLTVKDRQLMFNYKNRMINIPSNFPSKKENAMCVTKCGNFEDMEHIYNCEMLNASNRKKPPYKYIFNGNMKIQVEIFMFMKENMLKRQQIKENYSKHSE